jgi:23S rRNA (pseudouridine1915-N3)-methyltransferase
MHLKFLFIGRTKSTYLAEGISDFLSRINNYVKASEIIVKGQKVAPNKTGEAQAADTESLLAAIKPEEVFVHLDPRGRELTSRELSSWLREQMDGGAKTICFGLGGPVGLDERAARRANLRLCLSRMTLTHEMSRLVLLEQIYRGLRLIAGHPYHR